MRLSRIQAIDLPELLVLQIPVRCCSCDERFSVSLYRAWKLGLIGRPAQKPEEQDKNAGGGPAA
ncbi:MAG: hypothetical protein ACLQKY_02015 [Terracidiphilus sp.]